ncbi:chorismate-binding protein [Flavobacteriaceae bacterium GF1]
MPSPKSNEIIQKASAWLKNGLPFVIYRYPGDFWVRGIFQQDASLITAADFQVSGFLFAPFDTTSDMVLMPGKVNKGEIVPPQTKTHQKTVDLSENGMETYLELVKKTVSEIQESEVRKVVISRRIQRPTKKNPVAIICDLLAKYPNAFCYWWYHPKVGMWLGATPERLLTYKNGELFTTSLAGTLPVEKGIAPKWTPKELEEQQMVTNYILKSLEGKVGNLQVSEQKNVRAGGLWHLKSEIQGRLESKKDLYGIVNELHPTPAVCGLPKTRAFDFILNYEGYDREFYTGFLGTLNVEDKEEMDLFVNLRCFKYGAGNAQIFVGGGITSASVPQKEWEETQFKSKTILDVL